MTLKEIAFKLGLEYCGPPDLEITGLSSIEAAGQNDVCFVEDRRHLPLLENTKACAVIVFEGAENCPLPHIISPNPSLSFVKLINMFVPERMPPPGIHPTAVVSRLAHVDPTSYIGAHCVVDEGASIGEGCIIYPLVYIGRNAEIGPGTVVKPLVSILDDTRIGQRGIIHSGTVIGSDGYGFVKDGDRHVKIPQIGDVVIGDDVEIGACCAIDRARFGSTVIGSGCKLDNLVHIAHNVSIGENALLVAQVGIAGSCRIGKNSTLAGQVGVAGHITLGSNVTVASKSGIPRDLPDGAVVGGIPAVPLDLWRRQVAAMQRLPNVMKELRELRKEVESLKARLGQFEQS